MANKVDNGHGDHSTYILDILRISYSHEMLAVSWFSYGKQLSAFTSPLFAPSPPTPNGFQIVTAKYISN